MKFTEWLIIQEANIHFAGYFNDETIMVYIDGKRYTYLVDLLWHDKIKRIAKYRPGKALQFVKENGKQIDPPPKNNEELNI
jgi:hypothetical protein